MKFFIFSEFSVFTYIFVYFQVLLYFLYSQVFCIFFICFLYVLPLEFSLPLPIGFLSRKCIIYCLYYGANEYVSHTSDVDGLIIFVVRSSIQLGSISTFCPLRYFWALGYYHILAQKIRQQKMLKFIKILNYNKIFMYNFCAKLF